MDLAGNVETVSRDKLADLLNEDLSREYQAISGLALKRNNKTPRTFRRLH
jgi:hypothetical protein